MSDTLRISMWSGPRNVSTALMYAFRQRPDTRVVDEPLYGHYLTTTDADHPGAGTVRAAMDTDGARVVRDVLLGPSDRPVLFVKNMAHHVAGIDLGFLDDIENVLLTREPEAMLMSLSRILPEVDLDGTGLPDQVRILERIEGSGRQPIVLESSELLRDPASVLSELCRRLGIAFDPAMLAWPPGPKPEDGVWAPHWYANVHRSTGFARPTTDTHDFPDDLVQLLESCRPLYDRMAAYAIRARG
jgi:hypothetical protein